MKIDGIFTDITLTGALFPRETDLLTAVFKMNVYSLLYVLLVLSSKFR